MKTAMISKKMLSALRVLLVLFILMASDQRVWAGAAPYTTLTEDSQGQMVKSQHGYTPSDTLIKIGDESLNQPSDLFIDHADRLYILDSGNKRVLVSDLSGDLDAIIGTDVLQNPSGLYVDDEGNIYVADPGLEQVVAFSAEGEVIQRYERPSEALFGKHNPFVPQKVALDRGKNLYVISEGNTNGLCQLSYGGEFLGYFGANQTRVSLSEIIRRFFFSRDQRQQLSLNVPSSPENLDIDARGLVHTVSQGEGPGGLKKFNMAGVNMLKRGHVDNAIADLATGTLENIFAVSTHGYIYEYTREGDLLFLFGGRDDGQSRSGLFVSAVAIDVDQKGNLYVLDQESNKVEIFEKTEYAQNVHQALGLYQEGKYIESKAPWETVIRQNSLFDYAYRGTGQAFYKLEEYDESLLAFRRAGDKGGYSDSFWEVRNLFLRKNLIYIFSVVLILSALKLIYGALKRKYAWRGPKTLIVGKLNQCTLYRQVTYLKAVPKNPVDAYYGIRKERKVSILSSSIVYVLFFTIYIVNKYFSAFLFKHVRDGKYEVWSDVFQVGGILLLFIISHHLISSIRDGEGKLRDVYCALAYSLVPYILLKPISIVLSYVLTFNEAFIIHMLNLMMTILIVILIFIMVKEIQNYTLMETVMNLLLTLFTMGIFIITGVIIVSLISQVVDFFVAIVNEVSFRVG